MKKNKPARQSYIIAKPEIGPRLIPDLTTIMTSARWFASRANPPSTEKLKHKLAKSTRLVSTGDERPVLMMDAQ